MSKELEKTCLGEAKKIAGEDAFKEKKSLVIRIDFGKEGKINSSIMKTLTKANKDGSFMVVSADEENDAVAVFAATAKSGSIDAVKWCEAAIAPLSDPKANGREKNASGSGKGLAAIEAVLAAANKFVE